MSDIVSPEKRSAMMSGIRTKDTAPELAVRKALFASGYRFRLHYRKLPGSPDIVLVRHQIAIFVHGCFWHLHENCRLSRIPATRADFWSRKLGANVKRDRLSVDQLTGLGWRVLVIWECHIRQERDISALGRQLSGWINGREQLGEFPQKPQSKITP